MKLKNRDWYFIALLGAVLAVLLLSTAREKPKPVPADDRHRPFTEALPRGESRPEVEKECVTCHNPQSFPLPAQHPPKEQCLNCHKGQH